jgi:hypothetical protein
MNRTIQVSISRELCANQLTDAMHSSRLSARAHGHDPGQGHTRLKIHVSTSSGALPQLEQGGRKNFFTISGKSAPTV